MTLADYLVILGSWVLAYYAYRQGNLNGFKEGLQVRLASVESLQKDLDEHEAALKAYHDSLNAGRVELLENARKLDEVVGALDDLSSARVLAKLRDIRSVTIAAVPERQKAN